jgi:hypothetical protein
MRGKSDMTTVLPRFLGIECGSCGMLVMRLPVQSGIVATKNSNAAALTRFLYSPVSFLLPFVCHYKPRLV